MIAALFGVGVVTGGGEDGGDEPAEPAAASPDVERVAERLERVRKLRFEELPPVRTVSGEEARDEALAVLDEEYPPDQRAADERLLGLLGLVPAGTDIRELQGEITGQEVAGYYNDHTKEMALVEGTATGPDGEITLAHELTHALEDQHFDIETKDGLDDQQTARTALLEGTATVAMLDYVARYQSPGVRRAQLLDGVSATELFGIASDLPPYVEHALVFPYSRGARFVDAIGTWGPANRALAGRGPLSTEQILHPEKYEADERPLDVPAGIEAGGGWKRVESSTVGEFDTGELIRTASSPAQAADAAEGWGGGRYTVWRREDDYAVALRWRWDTPRDAAEFVAALPRYIEFTLRGRRAGPGLWRAPDRGFVAVGAGAVVRFAIAPTRALARRLAR